MLVGVLHNDGRGGYYNVAMTTAMVASLKADSKRWREEQQTIWSATAYPSSTTHRIHLQYGPTYRAPNATSRQTSARDRPLTVSANPTRSQPIPTTLYDAKDRRHLAQFRIERFLNEADNDYPQRCILDAPFNSYSRQHKPTYLPDTRVDILQKISKWADGKDERCFFWLNGLAGTGKSTIARTVARKYFERERLGASFFSSSGGDVSHADKFFTSIARQLANESPSLNHYICEAIAGWSAITDQSLRDKWRQLILRPLLRLDRNSSPSSFVLIVDALHDCEGENKYSVQLSAYMGSTALIQDNRPPSDGEVLQMSDEEALQIQRTSSLRRYGISRSGGKKNSEHDTGTIPPSQRGCETH